MGDRQRIFCEASVPFSGISASVPSATSFSIHCNAQHIAVVRIAIAQHFVSQHRSQRNRGLRRWDGHGIAVRSGRKPKCARFLHHLH